MESDIAGQKFRDTHRKTRWAESAFITILNSLAWLVVLIVFGIFVTLVVHSIPAIRDHGISFLISTDWDPVQGQFGGLVFLVGTLITSILALIIAMPFSLAIAIFLGEYVKTGWISTGLQTAVELLAGIPSIVYGFWGMVVVVPMVRNLQMSMGVAAYGVGAFTAALILALMIVPFSAAISRDVISLVPNEYREAAVALGATQSEVIRHCVLPYAKSGILAGVLLAFGRAFGETMAVTMVIGNTNAFPDTIFSHTNTMASVIANEFSEATSPIHISGLVEIGLILFVVSALISIGGRAIIRRFLVQS